jgi:transposase-like protein
VICRAEIIMKVEDFKVLLAELGSLTAVQRNALMSQSAGDVVALIEGEFAKAPACGHCGRKAFSRWGVATGMKRYQCKGCNRTFNALTRLWPICRSARKWVEYARAIVDGLSLRKAAKRVGMHLDNFVSLATSVSGDLQGRQTSGRHRHRGRGRDLNPQVGQRIETARRPSPEKARGTKPRKGSPPRSTMPS